MAGWGGRGGGGASSCPGPGTSLGGSQGMPASASAPPADSSCLCPVPSPVVLQGLTLLLLTSHPRCSPACRAPPGAAASPPSHGSSVLDQTRGREMRFSGRGWDGAPVLVLSPGAALTPPAVTGVREFFKPRRQIPRPALSCPARADGGGWRRRKGRPGYPQAGSEVQPGIPGSR